MISNTVEELLIDEECLFCSFGIVKVNKKEQPNFSDHNAFLLRLTIPHEKKKEPRLAKSWRLTSDGLEKFNQLTNENFEVGTLEGGVQEKYNNLESKVKEVMDECFKVKKRYKPHSVMKEYLPMYSKVTKFARGGKIQRHTARKYIELILKANTEKVAETRKTKIRMLNIYCE